MGTALFVVLSMRLQIPVFENYYLCLGCMALAVFCYFFGSLSGMTAYGIGVVIYCLIINGLRGMPGVRSIAESLLYTQPFIVRAAKCLYAFIADAAVLIISFPLCPALEPVLYRLFPELRKQYHSLPEFIPVPKRETYRKGGEPLIILICIAAVLLIVPIFFRFKLRIKDADNTGVYIRLSLLGFTLYRSILKFKIKNLICLEIHETRKEKTRVVYSFEHFKKRKKKKKNVFRKAALRTLTVNSILLKLIINTGDAAVSTLLCGFLQAAFDTAASVFSERVEYGRIEIMPDFQKTGVKFYLDCIITIRMADIIRDILFKKGGSKNAPDRKHTKGNHVRA